MFGTLIALLRDGVPVLGVLDQPITKERWVGAAGQQTTLNGALFNTASACMEYNTSKWEVARLPAVPA